MNSRVARGQLGATAIVHVEIHILKECSNLFAYPLMTVMKSGSRTSGPASRTSRSFTGRRRTLGSPGLGGSELGR